MVSNRWVLLVDDDEDFRQLFAAALKEGRATGISRDLHTDIAFIDLAMPGMDGLALVKDIRTRLGMQDLPIIVLTNSNLTDDAAAAYSSLASSYHCKPACYRDVVNLLRTVVPLWLNFRGDAAHVVAGSTPAS
jgi:CheY-like chemotaxis protein